LASLARHSFDFCADDLQGLEEGDRERLDRLFPTPFDSLLGPALRARERAKAKQRVMHVLTGVRR